ncbi:phosphate ABC transporter permease subunit PstC [Anaerocolumna chitinilytica]|jgi:phosphate transport system permease protein|uniref:Phosphate transport system permease protein n=1 Tax=Anaerocolumna chitinilytica TaxID=1727145 RepID=A0A7I8DHR9_9FIRM|nr:phosphate ABC transporter permease subunit PstC [Anaerocolumna chitinilytica]BCJ97227.1 phosphate transport system permease protein [Anaerocolumna chitinilytica]
MKTQKVYLYNSIFKAIVFFFAFITVLSVVLIGVFMVMNGGPSIAKVGLKDFLLGKVWNSANEPPQYGILAFILSSFYSTFFTVLIAVPISILVAVAIGQLMPKRLGSVIRMIISLLAGIPSVIYGFLGIIFIVPLVQKIFDLSSGLTMLSSVIVLIIMTLPTIISVSETSINAVDKGYLEAAYALGVRKEYALFTVILPAAKSGIMAAVLLGVGRAIGETMAVMMVAGNIPQMPSMLKPVRFLTTAIVTEMSYATEQTRGVLIGIGLVLFVFVFIINSIFHILIKKAGGANV